MRNRIIYTFIFLCVIFCACQTETNKETLSDQVYVQLQSKNYSLRRGAIVKIAELKLLQFVPNIKEIIYDPNVHESERVLASRTLAELIQKKSKMDMFLLLHRQKPILQHCGLEIFVYLVKKQYSLPEFKTLTPIVYKLLTNSSKEEIKRKSAFILGLLRYSPAYPILLRSLQDGSGIYDELIIALALLGNPKRNKTIISTYKSLIADIRDKRLLRSINTGYYIIRNNNKMLPIFEAKPMNMLSDMGTDNFNYGYNAESYFLLYKNVNPQKIAMIKSQRIALFILALQDNNAKIRFKAAKLLGEMKNKSCCQPLWRFYQTNIRKQSQHAAYTNKVLADIALVSLAKLKCDNIKNILFTTKTKNKYFSQLLDYLKGDSKFAEKNNRFFLEHPLLFSQKELFPTDLSLIDYLVSYPQKKVRVQAIYSLFLNEIPRKLTLLSKLLKNEPDAEIRSFISQLIKNVKGFAK